MSDFSLRNELVVEVQPSVSARKVRRWILLNKSGRVLDFSSFAFHFDVTSEDVQVEDASDAAGADLRWETESLPEGMTRVRVHFDKQLSPGEEYAVAVTYRQPHYFVLLPNLKVWLLSEWFAHLAELEDLDASREEPERWLFTVRVQDPRRTWMKVRDPRYAVHVDCSPPSLQEQGDDPCALRWEFNIPPGNVRRDFWIGYSLTSRLTVRQFFAVAGPSIGLVGAAATIISLVLT